MTRGAITTERLIVVAERLYADHGLDAVSLRQIADAAGQKNHAVVQYHFGTKEELLKAVVREALIPNIARAERLAAGHSGSCADLLRLIFELAARRVSRSRLSAIPKLG